MMLKILITIIVIAIVSAILWFAIKWGEQGKCSSFVGYIITIAVAYGFYQFEKLLFEDE